MFRNIVKLHSLQLLVIQMVAGRQVVVDWAMAKARFMDASAQPSGQSSNIASAAASGASAADAMPALSAANIAVIPRCYCHF